MRSGEDHTTGGAPSFTALSALGEQGSDIVDAGEVSLDMLSVGRTLHALTDRWEIVAKMLSAAAAPVLVLDRDLNIIAATPDAALKAGLHRGTVEGMSWDGLGLPMDEEFLIRLENVLNAGVKTHSEGVSVLREGRRYYEYVLDPMMASDGDVIAIAASVRDITRERVVEEELNASLKRLHQVLGSAITVISRTLRFKDPYTQGHSQRVAALAADIARRMSLEEHTVEAVRMAGLVHDIGKIAIRSELLTRPSKLTEGEIAIIRTHPEVSRAILADVEFPWPIAEIAYQHHERLDGSGYPQGLSGGDILLEAKILAVADVMEAMTNARPFRPPLGPRLALAEIESGSGRLYDPAVQEACSHLFRTPGFVLPETPDPWLETAE